MQNVLWACRDPVTRVTGRARSGDFGVIRSDTLAPALCARTRSQMQADSESPRDVYGSISSTGMC